ncbi:MAG: GNAT family N-acetyltransferase [Rhabdochlamydiaceae bacterium]|nr:GNAT family N-acetyltransferase [Candidatus Amphrikana amoebophyrae]
MLWKKDKLSIRQAEISDSEPLIQFLMEPGVLPYFPMCELKEVEDAAKVSVSYRDSNAAFTAEYDGEICGNTILYISPFTKNKRQCLFMIIVGEKFRNKGIGSMMLDHLFEVAKNEHNINLLHLEVYEDNPARKLYERKGFEQYGVHPKFLKEPDGFRDKILMQKKL